MQPYAKYGRLLFVVLSFAIENTKELDKIPITFPF